MIKQPEVEQALKTILRACDGQEGLVKRELKYLLNDTNHVDTSKDEEVQAD